jgi:hypothetical protein
MATGGGPPLRSDVDVAAAREAIRVEFETLKGEMHKMSARDATVSARRLRLQKNSLWSPPLRTLGLFAAACGHEFYVSLSVLRRPLGVRGCEEGTHALSVLCQSTTGFALHACVLTTLVCVMGIVVAVPSLRTLCVFASS